ncbi:hypothetical protein KL86APRO_12226 [uncultured Alphaproteobacteria bacterium]|uniref:Tyr recombinase domain-containing protein n=1 Tax=uncultured Alphaproteobacteria bacterium TaxID=91750 RepID=A0A212K6Q1_9PROT|nr:hypothetical protein KL86APRO_12226 [uncultured Alphaproteobacteria bacterium]
MELAAIRSSRAAPLRKTLSRRNIRSRTLRSRSGAAFVRHLRHTAVTELATAGCSALEIAGVTGHTLKSVNEIPERYLVRTSDLAAAATENRLAHGDYSALKAKNLSREHAKNE